jgi:hypothetical protein
MKEGYLGVYLKSGMTKGLDYHIIHILFGKDSVSIKMISSKNICN